MLISCGVVVKLLKVQRQETVNRDDFLLKFQSYALETYWLQQFESKLDVFLSIVTWKQPRTCSSHRPSPEAGITNWSLGLCDWKLNQPLNRNARFSTASVCFEVSGTFLLKSTCNALSTTHKFVWLTGKMKQSPSCSEVFCWDTSYHACRCFFDT